MAFLSACSGTLPRRLFIAVALLTAVFAAGGEFLWERLDRGWQDCLRGRAIKIEIITGLLAGMIALLTLSLPIEAQAVETGYWKCENGAWVGVGAPNHPQPLKQCGTERPKPIGNEADCVARGGTWRAMGIFPRKLCVMPTEDAGRTCGDAGECQGTCLADLSKAQQHAVKNGRSVSTLGKCSPAIPIVGCHAIVHQGVVRQIVCLD